MTKDITLKYIANKQYHDAPAHPIKISKDEVLTFIQESNPQGDWPNWMLCQGVEKEGWVPKQILRIEGTQATALFDYDATEFNLKEGEVLISYRKMNGWIYGFKESKPTVIGWAPLNCLQLIA
ncbi:hypothetical protein F9817_13190 [Vibrio sp. CAIM 722]|uniref:SH3 domain-containing protein n=1 Tax=Vibrio eleionomae TaxID=2653505 RepID=A0A7X4RV42_9VIBR|nr:hypothetical protein [Vibrio eleionomae]